MLKYGLYMLLFVSLIAGCSPVPEPSSYGHTIQPKIQSAHHWEVLAEDVAKQIKARLDVPYGTGKDAGIFFVPKREESTSFSEGFHDLLISNMVEEGMTVAPKIMDGVRVVDYEVKVVHHKASRSEGRPESKIGQYLREGITVIRDAVTLGAIHAEHVPHTEVIVTVSIAENNEFLLHRSDVYYINDPDFGHYGASGPSLKTMAVVGDK